MRCVFVCVFKGKHINTLYTQKTGSLDLINKVVVEKQEDNF